MSNSIFTRAIIALAAAIFMAGAAHAQTTILVVDSAKVLRDSSAGKSVQTQLQSIASTIQSEAQSTMSPVTSEKQAFASSNASLKVSDLQSRPDLAAQLKTIQEKEVKAQNELRYKSAELQATERKALLNVSQKIDEVIAGLARERGATAVFDKSMLLYAGSTVDVTQEVISRLNRQMPSVAVTRERLPRTQ